VESFASEGSSLLLLPLLSPSVSLLWWLLLLWHRHGKQHQIRVLPFWRL
jgi:hypothetical protein